MVSSITEAKQLKAPNACMLDLNDHPSLSLIAIKIVLS
ncbi:hypothetical protein RDI58_008063 [Solanum bulbocastanum]|uniref:Uncharacterized protein n=1 Tax=Solanum bulbocastanum TaxID=147425 RepID=A0AAN8TVW4_SOLBU